MEIVLIAAMAANRTIGKDGNLPWCIPEDLKRFKRLTTGHAILMGRVTFESIGSKPLPDRRNMVLTTQSLSIPSVETFSSIEDVLNLLNVQILFVIGGSSVYAQMLPFADRVELTRLDRDYDGDSKLISFEHCFDLESYKRTDFGRYETWRVKNVFGQK